MGWDAPEEGAPGVLPNYLNSEYGQEESNDSTLANSDPPGNGADGTVCVPFIPPGRVQSRQRRSRSPSVESNASDTSKEASISIKMEDSLEKEYHMIKL